MARTSSRSETSGTVHDRAVRLAARLWLPMLLLAWSAWRPRSGFGPAYSRTTARWPVGWLIPAVVLASAIAMAYGRRTHAISRPLCASSLFIAAMLAGAAFALYPLLLPSSNSIHPSLTTLNSLAPAYGLRIGIRWWSAGFVLAMTYAVWMYRSIGTKVDSLEPRPDHR